MTMDASAFWKWYSSLCIPNLDLASHFHLILSNMRHFVILAEVSVAMAMSTFKSHQNLKSETWHIKPFLKTKFNSNRSTLKFWPKDRLQCKMVHISFLVFCCIILCSMLNTNTTKSQIPGHQGFWDIGTISILRNIVSIHIKIETWHKYIYI